MDWIACAPGKELCETETLLKGEQHKKQKNRPKYSLGYPHPLYQSPYIVAFQ